MNYPIIFLDIDGVLRSIKYEKFRISHNLPWFDTNGPLFDPNCITALSTLINATDAKLVIHSSWKDGRTSASPLSIIRKIWGDRNLPGELVDITPTLSSDELMNLYGLNVTKKWKGYEIDLWLSQNTAYDSYVIIDNQDIVLDYQKKFFVRTNGKKGLQNSDIKKAINILTG